MSHFNHDEDYGGGVNMQVKKKKARFSSSEVHVLLNEVKKNRSLLVSKFRTRGSSSDVKKEKWASITALINKTSECPRKATDVSKKWADLKCDAKRRMAAMRGPNGLRIAQNLSPVEKMVHDILKMPVSDAAVARELYRRDPSDDSLSPGTSNGVVSAPDLRRRGGPLPSVSPLSAPDKALGRRSQTSYAWDPPQSSQDFEFEMPIDEDESLEFEEDPAEEPRRGSFRPPTFPPPPLDPVEEDTHTLRTEPHRTHTRTSSASTAIVSSSSFATTSSSRRPTAPSLSTSRPPLPSSSTPRPPLPSSSTPRPPLPSSSSPRPPFPSFSTPRPPLPIFSTPRPPLPSSSTPRQTMGWGGGGDQVLQAQERLAHSACLSVQQQQASRALLGSVSQSLGVLARSVHHLAQTQQEFVRTSLQLQRDTVDVLRDFSTNALAFLRDKAHGCP